VAVGIALWAATLMLTHHPLALELRRLLPGPTGTGTGTGTGTLP